MLQKERTVERRKTESEAAPPIAGPSQDETGELTFPRTKAEKEYGLTSVYSQQKLESKLFFDTSKSVSDLSLKFSHENER